jgi:ABC-type sugar transport system ATPase subunit
MTGQNAAPLLEMQGIVKSFEGTRAVDGVDFTCSAGEIHCLVGENGAGKSTLVKVLAGVHIPDAGRILLRGDPRRFAGYAESRKAGIGIVYQELSLLPELSVAENIVMGAWPLGRGALVDWEQARAVSVRILSGIGVTLDPSTLVGSLPMALRQMVEIAKVLSQESDLIVFDEPTAPLSHDEVAILFGIFRDLKSRGKGIVFISHRLDEVLAVSDRITVMKDGRVVATDRTAAFDEDRLVTSMVGRSMSEIFPPKAEPAADAPTLFAFDGALAATATSVSFGVRQGEVLGFGGLQGQGQQEVLQAIFGLPGCEVRKMAVGGRAVTVRTPAQAMRHGIALVPENRIEEGVFPVLSVRENLSAPTIGRRSRLGFVRRAQEQETVRDMVSRLSIHIASQRQPASALSGGNMQKLVLGKWLIFDPRVVVLLEPTKGVDVATKQEIYRLIRELSQRGVAVILSTSDMLELIGVCDRVLVMNHGMLTGCLRGTSITEENIMKASVRNTALAGEESCA